MKLSEKICQLRLEKNWSSGRLAKEAGVSRGYLWQIESGVRESPSLHILQQLAGALGTNVSDLCDVDAPEPATDGLPPGLEQFVKEKGAELGVRKADIEIMKNIRFRGCQPDNPEDWALLFLFLKKWAG